MTTVAEENVVLKTAEKHYEKGEYNDAIDIYTTLLSDEELRSLYVDRAKCYFQLKDYRQCIDDIKSAAEPDNIDACILAGKAACELVDFDEAYKQFKVGLEIEPKHPDIIQGFQRLQKLIVNEVKEKSASVQETSYNALKICSQDPYPGDDMLLVMEKDILAKRYNIPGPETINAAPNKKLAAKAAKEANRCRTQNSLTEAIEYIDKSVELDPNNWVYHQFRGEIYLQKGEPIKTLRNFWSIPKELRKLGVWKLGGQILRELKMPILTEMWLRRVNKMSKGEDEDAAMIFQQVRVERLYSPLTKNFPVYVDFSKYGRGIYAAEDIKGGDVIFTDKPVVMAQSLDTYSRKACFQCGACLLTASDYFGSKWLNMDGSVRKLVNELWPEVTSVKCDKCKRERYCNEECRNLARELYHEVICPARNTAAGKLYDLCENNGVDENGKTIWDGHFSPLILVKIWANIVSNAKLITKENGESVPTKDNWAMAKAPYRKFIAYGVPVKPSSLPEFAKLVRDIFQDCGDGVRYEITDQEFSGRYCQASCNLQSYGASFSSPYSIFLSKVLDLDEDSTFKLVSCIHEQADIASFAGMFPLHACLNHACANNVEVTDGFEKSGCVSVRAKHNIKKGQELLTTYIDTSMPRLLRRAWLYRSFNFWCNCHRCQFEGDDAELCTECESKAPDDKKYAACGGCKRAWYCSTKCQKKAWVSGHKKVCKMVHSKVEQEKSPADMLKDKIDQMNYK